MIKPRLKALIIAFMAMLSAVGAFAQNKVTGVVSDPEGEPIIGAYITLASDKSVGTITDFDGNFELSVPANASLIISYTGYESQTVAVGNRSSIDVVLAEASNHLDEVVAVGYGSQKAKEITSSVASVKSENFNQGVKESPMGLLQGKVAGLNISRSGGGDPTSTGYNIQLRGFSTLDKGAGSSPLYVVDGIPVDNIDNIAPEDIESMDVLKDGSSAAIYGTRGTNGVILITTKRGSDPNSAECGSVSLEYAGYVSVATQAGKTGLSTPSEYLQLEELSGGKVKPNIYKDADGKSYETDWMSEISKKAAVTHSHNVAISGAAKNFGYRGSVTFKNAEGIAIGSNRREINAKLAANQKALQGWLDLAYDFSYMNYRNDYACSSFKQASILNPTYPVYDETNKVSGYFIPSGSGQSNPVEAMKLKESYQTGNYFRGSVKATVNILAVKGLKFNAFAAFEEGDNSSYWYNQQAYADTDADAAGKAGRSGNTNRNVLTEATVDYTNQWGQHSLSLVGGFSYQYFIYDEYSMENGGFAYDGIKYYRMGEGKADKTLMSMGSSRNSHALASGFARANYNYAEKYLASVSLRAEGSSRFGENNKWGWFPAASIGWRISGEDFLKDAENVDDLKIRFGFGITGNDLNASLKSQAILASGGQFWYNGNYVTTYKAASTPNPYLQWEKKYEYNLGFDFSFLKSRLFGSIDAYYRNTTDLLWDYSVTVGDVTANGLKIYYETLLANAGTINSKGVELALTGVPVKTDNWNWTSGITLAWNNNKITKLSNPEIGLNYSETLCGDFSENGLMGVKTQRIVEGQSVGTFYGYEVDHSQGDNGINSKGNLIYKDQNGDGKITSEDKVNLGNAQPILTYGWNNTIRYKWFDLTLFFRGVIGNKVLNVARWAYGPQAKPGTAVYMKDVAGLADNTSVLRQSDFSDYYLESGSYLKLDNITLGFNCPLKPNKYCQSLRIYFTAQNVFTITSYSGMDPEVNTSSVWSSGIDNCDFYPTVRNFMLGVNVKF